MSILRHQKREKNLTRYSLSDEEILAAAQVCIYKHYGSIALQSGELESNLVTDRIENLLYKIKELSAGRLGVTLSVGEQEPEVYKKWYDAGAHRYLLRIEATNNLSITRSILMIQSMILNDRLDCLKSLQDIGYQTGTGVMIGLPFQTMDDLAGDLIFMKNFNIDMCGMGPYIEHADTHLIEYSENLLPLNDRFDLTLKMIAISNNDEGYKYCGSHSSQAIDPIGREKAVMIGANILMPNITPGKYRDSYKLYDNKPCTDDSAEDCQSCLEARVALRMQK